MKQSRALRERLAAKLAATVERSRSSKSELDDSPLATARRAFRSASAEQIAEAADASARFVEWLARELIPDARVCAAALDRKELAERWDFRDAPQDIPERVDDLLFCAGLEDLFGKPYESPWPGNVAPDDLFKALQRIAEGGDKDAGWAAAMFGGGETAWWLIADSADASERKRLLLSSWEAAEAESRAARAYLVEGLKREESAERWGGRQRANRAFSATSVRELITNPYGNVDEPRDRACRRWPILACARIVSAERAVHEDRARRIVPLPSSDAARAAFAVVSQGPNGPWTPSLVAGSTLELVWDGKPRPYNLSLDLGPVFEGAIVEGILAELAADGLRDWLVLHRMAAEQGRSGALTWRWSEHRERTAYDRRIRSDNVGDAEQAEAVTRRLLRLKRAELKQSVVRADGKVAWARIGPFGLLDIPAAVEAADRSLELARLTINPALYRGAERGAARPHFTLLPDDALSLSGERLRLATLLAIQMRYARDDGGAVTLKASTLWEWMGLGRPPRTRWARLTDTLAKALRDLETAGVLGGWEREAGPPAAEARYELRPPAWWRDQVIHGVTPALPPSRATLPRTGEELRAWRSAHGLSQAAAADALGVGKRTIVRAELAPAEPLGRALSTALANRKPEP